MISSSKSAAGVKYDSSCDSNLELFLANYSKFLYIQSRPTKDERSQGLYELKVVLDSIPSRDSYLDFLYSSVMALIIPITSLSATMTLPALDLVHAPLASFASTFSMDAESFDMNSTPGTLDSIDAIDAIETDESTHRNTMHNTKNQTKQDETTFSLIMSSLDKNRFLWGSLILLNDFITSETDLDLVMAQLEFPYRNKLEQWILDLWKVRFTSPFSLLTSYLMVEFHILTATY